MGCWNYIHMKIHYQLPNLPESSNPIQPHPTLLPVFQKNTPKHNTNPGTQIHPFQPTESPAGPLHPPNCQVIRSLRYPTCHTSHDSHDSKQKTAGNRFLLKLLKGSKKEIIGPKKNRKRIDPQQKIIKSGLFKPFAVGKKVGMQFSTDSFGGELFLTRKARWLKKLCKDLRIPYIIF